MKRLMIFVMLLSGFFRAVSHAEPCPVGEPCLVNENMSPAYAGKPVSLLTGEESLRRTDLIIGAISIERRYSSRSEKESVIGYGWTHNHLKSVAVYPDGSVNLRRENGAAKRFSLKDSTFVPPVGEYGSVSVSADNSVVYTAKDGKREQYDANGMLTSKTDPRTGGLGYEYEDTPSQFSVTFGPKRLVRISETDQSGASTGRWVTFVYHPSTGRLIRIADNLGRNVSYGHDENGNLKLVSAPRMNATYGYNDQNGIHRLTDISENGDTITNTYDAKGWIVRQTHGTGTIDIDYTKRFNSAQVTTTVRDSSGNTLDIRIRTVEFNELGSLSRTIDPLGNQVIYLRNDNDQLVREESWENSSTPQNPMLILAGATDYTYDAIGNLLTMTEASGTALKRVTSYGYDPVFNQEASETVTSVIDPQKNKTTVKNYNSQGNLTSITVSGLGCDGKAFSHTTSFEYNSRGKLTKRTGPRTDVADVTTYVYDDKGNLISSTAPLIGTITYSDHDGFGHPRGITDPNGATITYTYDSEGRVLSVKLPGDITPTSYSYTPAGGCSSCGTSSDNLQSITFPEGNGISYTYDPSGRLATITDSLGNSINYSYDSEGNKLKEEIKDKSGLLQKTLSYQYDALNRLKQIKKPDTSYTEYGYDSRNNRTSLRAPNSNVTAFRYDTLNRLVATIQPGNITTSVEYDTHDNLTKVTDGNNNATGYRYDDLGRVCATISPDTGTSTYSYDPNGNMLNNTDANGITTSYVYDALNRVTTISFPDPKDNVTYTYDNCTNGKGRLCAMIDPSGTTTYEYTVKGQTKKETKTIDSQTFVTEYGYDQNGNITTVKYPSGRTIAYSYVNDRVTGITNNGTAIASGIAYKPFGGMTNLTYGNGIQQAISYDQQYRITNITANSIQNLSYGYDKNGNIAQITDNLNNAKSQTYGYDSLDRLANAQGPWGGLAYIYDKAGNRTTENHNDLSTAYGYKPNTNQLITMTGEKNYAFGFDANGNTTTENNRHYIYDQNQRLIKVAEQTTTKDGQDVTNTTTKGEYTYNGSGQRQKKTVNGQTTYFVFDQQGQLIAESGTSQTDYIFLNGNPYAIVYNDIISYIHIDHLGTPRVMSDGAKAKVWEITTQPFGDNATISGTSALNIRFPGQYYDQEIELNYNYFRDYNPHTGRYAEADPIGLDGGINLFAYTSNNPVNWTDPIGLKPCCDAQLPAGPIGEVALTCFAESSSACTEGANEKRAITDSIYNRASADRKQWGGGTVMGVLKKKDRKGRYMFQGFHSAQYNLAKNITKLDNKQCKKLKECIDAATKSSSSTKYNYTSFNQAGKPTFCVHRFFVE